MNFSIIIPAKNEEFNIERCLQSIFSIDYDTEQYEVIVVDNGSEDKTVAVAQKLGAQIYIKPELTISALRNFGASKAKGDIFVFLDADCTVQENWLLAADRYVKDPKIACFGSPPIVPRDATWVQKTWFVVRMNTSEISEVEWLESMNMFIPRQIFEKVQGFNEDLVTCEDYDLSIRLQPCGRIISDSRIVAIHHGEAADVKHFFRKEYWRATSNVERFKSRNFNLVELPSLLIPPLYCLLAVMLILWLIVFGIFDSQLINIGWIILLLVWQLPIFFISAWKVRHAWSLRLASQLFIILNVYFSARGSCFFKGILIPDREK